MISVLCGVQSRHDSFCFSIALGIETYWNCPGRETTICHKSNSDVLLCRWVFVATISESPVRNKAPVWWQGSNLYFISIFSLASQPSVRLLIHWTNPKSWCYVSGMTSYPELLLSWRDKVWASNPYVTPKVLAASKICTHQLTALGNRQDFEWCGTWFSVISEVPCNK